GRRHTRSKRDWSSDVCSSDLSFDTLSAFTWEACVDYYADDSELKSYGLDAAEAVISIAYTPVQEEDEANEENKEEKASFEYEVRSEERQVGKECRTKGSTAVE